MSNIKLLRIDDRLIHGQVMTAWVKHVSANKIIIVDNSVSKDKFLKKVMVMAAPKNIEVEVYGENDIQEISNNLVQEDNVIILVKTPEVVEKLRDNKFEFKNVILGGMGSKPGRNNLFRNISVSNEEINTFKRLINKGVDINVQIVPDDKAINIMDLLKKYEQRVSEK